MILMILLAFFILLYPPKAYAYLDPGTGSYIIQIVIAALLGGTIAFKSYLGRIISIFKFKAKNDKEQKEK